MHIRATGCLLLGLAGLLSCTVEEVFAAEDLSEKNNLTRAKSGPHRENLPARDTPVKSGPDNPVQRDISFSTYGSHSEHIGVVIKNQDTGEGIREIPSEEMQKLHVHLDVLILVITSVQSTHLLPVR